MVSTVSLCVVSLSDVISGDGERDPAEPGICLHMCQGENQHMPFCHWSVRTANRSPGPQQPGRQQQVTTYPLGLCGCTRPTSAAMLKRWSLRWKKTWFIDYSTCRKSDTLPGHQCSHIHHSLTTMHNLVFSQSKHALFGTVRGNWSTRWTCWGQTQVHSCCYFSYCIEIRYFRFRLTVLCI